MGLPYVVGARICFAIGMVLSLVALGRVVGFESPWFALIAAFCVLGLLDLAMPFFRIRMPETLRKVRSWECRGGAYQVIGVTAFGEILRRTPLRLLNRRVYLQATFRDLPAVRTHVENAEAAHFWGGLVTVPFLAFALSKGWWVSLTSVLLFNLIVNVYPILHLRFVRARIEDVLRKNQSSNLIRKNG